MRAGFGKLCTGALCGVLALSAAQAFGQDEGEKRSKVSDAALSAEQLAIYRTVLKEWAQGDRAAINLSMLTEPLGDSEIEDRRDCLKGHVFEPASPNLVHRIREGDLASLGNYRFRLVDPDQYAQEVKANDPENAIYEGKKGGDLEKAVDHAFAHGLFTLGEIQFDNSHTYAVVSFSFWCGRLCGHGSTWVMKKSEGKWRRIKTCGDWIS